MRTDPGLDGMGCTVVAALYDGRGVSWLSVGDLPMWLFADGRLERLNADHSMAPVLRRMVETGELSAEDARRDSRRNMLRSAVTPESPELVDSAFRSCRLGPADYLLIASDGLETLSEAEIAQALRAARDDPEQAADSLFSAVRAAAGPRQDNMTFLLLSGESDPAGRAPPPPGAARRVVRQWPGFAFGLATGAPAVALGLWLLGAVSLPAGRGNRIGDENAPPGTGEGRRTSRCRPRQCRHSKTLTGAVDRALQTRIEDRPQSIGDWLRILEPSASASRPSPPSSAPARPSSGGKRTDRKQSGRVEPAAGQRNRSKALLFAVLGLAAAVAVGGASTGGPKWRIRARLSPRKSRQSAACWIEATLRAPAARLRRRAEWGLTRQRPANWKRRSQRRNGPLA